MNYNEGQCPLVAKCIMTFSINHNDHWKCWCHTCTDIKYLNKQNSELFAVLTDRVHLYHHQACCHLCRTLAAVASPCREKKKHVCFIQCFVSFIHERRDNCTGYRRSQKQNLLLFQQAVDGDLQRPGLEEQQRAEGVEERLQRLRQVAALLGAEAWRQAVVG